MRSRADAAPGWLHVPEFGAAGTRVALDADTHHYLRRVCRALPGDTVHLTDGRGAVARARLESAGREMVAAIESRDQRTRERHATLVCGPPESGRADWLVEKLGELGVAVFQPVECERGGWTKADARLDRWRRLAVAALRQSRRPFLLEVRPPARLADVLAAIPSGEDLWLADPQAEPAASETPAPVTLGLVGPSGGFSDAERGSIMARGARPISLSDGRLRTETAAIAWSAWWAGPRSAAGLRGT